eukprot:COSAG03_NODE_22497_length_290_cov_0.853403_1_plen_45_part_01
MEIYFANCKRSACVFGERVQSIVNILRRLPPLNDAWYVSLQTETN